MFSGQLPSYSKSHAFHVVHVNACGRNFLARPYRHLEPGAKCLPPPRLPLHVLLPTSVPPLCHPAISHLAYSSHHPHTLCNHAEPGSRCHQVLCGEAATGQVHVPGWPVRSLPVWVPVATSLPAVYCGGARFVLLGTCSCWPLTPLGRAQSVSADHWRKRLRRPLERGAVANSEDGAAWCALPGVLNEAGPFLGVVHLGCWPPCVLTVSRSACTRADFALVSLRGAPLVLFLTPSRGHGYFSSLFGVRAAVLG